VRLLLDHHYPTPIAVELRRRGHDVETASDRNLHWVDDETLLSVLAGEGRALLTNNARDFVRIVVSWASLEQGHAGLILTSDVSLRRTAQAIGTYVERLDALLSANPGDEAFRDRVHWL
jgi:hypothetical protein